MQPPSIAVSMSCTRFVEPGASCSSVLRGSIRALLDYTCRMTMRSLVFAGMIAAGCGGSALQVARPDSVIPAVDDAPTKAGDYNWMDRHDAVVNRVKHGNVDLILVGDSITHGWGGSPDMTRGDSIGELWTRYYASRNAVNEGFGWDKTQHVLWRFDHGEIDGISPKLATVMIGTNNLDSDSTQDIATGIAAVVDELQRKLPHTKILLLAIFPRGSSPTDPYRAKIAEVN